MIIILLVLSLIIGIFYGLSGFDFALLSAISQNSKLILYVLMFSVGISIGMQKGIFKKISTYHFKIFIIPIGIVAGSILGGIVSSLILSIPLNHGAAVASGMGWYSLAGVTISDMVDAELGSIAFMSNLMRELFSFMLIPVIAKYLNYYTCIAPAGATSEDTTLPVMLKYTNEETVVLSVFNGVICSFMVPILISWCLGL